MERFSFLEDLLGGVDEVRVGLGGIDALLSVDAPRSSCQRGPTWHRWLRRLSFCMQIVPKACCPRM